MKAAITGAWAFIGQALNEYCDTLPPAASAALREKLQQQADTMRPCIEAGIAALEKPPRKPRGGDSTKKPA